MLVDDNVLQEREGGGVLLHPHTQYMVTRWWLAIVGSRGVSIGSRGRRVTIGGPWMGGSIVGARGWLLVVSCLGWLRSSIRGIRLIACEERQK